MKAKQGDNQKTDAPRFLRIPLLVHYQVLDGDGILLDLRNQLYFGLDDVGCRIWQLVREKGSEAAIAEVLAQEYEVPPAECRRDLAEWLDDLIERKLLEASLDPFPEPLLEPADPPADRPADQPSSD